jgi:uncharacterized protein YecT (DUF1311 family)
MRIVLAIVLLTAAGSAAAQDSATVHSLCAHAEDTIEYNACSAKELAQAQAALDSTFRAVLAKWHDSPESVEALRRAQGAWQAAFEADVAARFAEADFASARGEWVGTAYQSAHNWYEAKLVQDRADHLCEFLRGGPYGERSNDSCDNLVHAALGEATH